MGLVIGVWGDTKDTATKLT